MRRSAANGARAPLLLPTKEILPLAIAVPELEVRAEAPLGSGRPALPGPLQEDVFPYLQLGGGRALCRGAHARGQRHGSPVPERFTDDELRLERLRRRGEARLDGEPVQARDTPDPLLDASLVRAQGDRCRGGGPHRPLDDIERSEDDHAAAVADDPELSLRSRVREVVPDPDRIVRDAVDVEANAEFGSFPARRNVGQALPEIDQGLFGAQRLRVEGGLHLDVAGDEQVVHRSQQFGMPLNDGPELLRVRVPDVEEVHRKIQALPRVHLERHLSPAVDVAAPALPLEMLENDLLAADDRVRPDLVEDLPVTVEGEGA